MNASIRTPRARKLRLTISGAARAARASSVRIPGVCHSKRPPRSAFSRMLTRNWQATSRAMRGSSQLSHASERSPFEKRRCAPRCNPQPETVTNSGAAIPPKAAATKAAGWPTVIPLGGMIAAVWTSTMHRIAMARIWSMCLSRIPSPDDVCDSRLHINLVALNSECRGEIFGHTLGQSSAMINDD